LIFETKSSMNPPDLDVVNYYNSVKTLGMTEAEKQDRVEYLKSL
jgi:hypothetical protein